MTTKELIKWLEEKNIKYRENDSWIFIQNRNDTKLIELDKTENAIYFEECILFELDPRNSRDITTKDLKKIIEYVETPIEDREEPKKFYIKPKGMKLDGGIVFNYTIDSKHWFIDDKSEVVMFKTQFTLKELEDLGIDVEHYDLEEVEDE